MIFTTEHRNCLQTLFRVQRKRLHLLARADAASLHRQQPSRRGKYALACETPATRSLRRDKHPPIGSESVKTKPDTMRKKTRRRSPVIPCYSRTTSTWVASGQLSYLWTSRRRSGARDQPSVGRPREPRFRRFARRLRLSPCGLGIKAASLCELATEPIDEGRRRSHDIHRGWAAGPPPRPCAAHIIIVALLSRCGCAGAYSFCRSTMCNKLINGL